MDSTITVTGVKMMIYYFNRLMRQAIAGLHVQENSLAVVQDLLKQHKKVVLVPMYTSHADCFIHLYVHNHYGLDIPFIFGNKEDSVNLSFFVKLLKKTGYIHARRSSKQSLQSRYVNSSMVREVIGDNKLTMIFQNKERLRTGKFYRRTQADLSIEWIVEAY